MSLTAEHLDQHLQTLESSLEHLLASSKNQIEYDIFRNAAIKGFELSLETAGKLIRKLLKLYEANPKKIDQLPYKDTLRYMAKYALLDTASVERWFLYRDNRNNTAHDYGKAFAEETLKLLPNFIQDAKNLSAILKQKFDHANTHT